MPLLEGWPTKAKEAPSPHEVILRPLDTNPVFQCLEEKRLISQKKGFMGRAKYINYCSWVNQQNLHYSEFHVFEFFRCTYPLLSVKKKYINTNIPTNIQKHKIQTIF